MIPGNAFREVFIVRRNHIQARAIDSLLHTGSLFAGVGASHLPGKEGVLALLQQMGYRVRPVQLTGNASVKRNRYEDRMVPQTDRVNWSTDSLFRVSVPGSMYQMETEYPLLNRWQYADMANGVYYHVTRIPTYAAFQRQSINQLIIQTDSLLFENIPGKIQDKIFFRQTPFDGIEVSSKTRRGDWQRLRFYFTDFEIILFKISGPEKLVQDSIGNQFFQSIRFDLSKQQYPYIHRGEAFQLSLPKGIGNEIYNRQTSPERWEWTAIDSSRDQTVILLKSSLHQVSFLDEDSIYIRLMETSFLGKMENLQMHRRTWTNWKNKPCLETLVQTNQVWYRIRILQQGAQLLLMASSATDSSRLSLAVFDQLVWQPEPISWQWQEDTVLQIRVPAAPLVQ
ncbi:MAG TPA: TraB/GumN family protein, partial [Ferruginibacter sp.]|nr:TraB/GumN family protein [Ferruginibacter sp.]